MRFRDEWVDAKSPVRLRIVRGEYAGQDCTLRSTNFGTLDHWVRLDNGLCVVVSDYDTTDADKVVA